MSDAITAGLHLLGRGKVLFDRYDNSGLSTGLRHMGNVEDLKINIATEKIEKRDFTQAAAPIAVEAITKTTGTVTMVSDEYGLENIAIFMLGLEAALTTQGSGSFALPGTPDTLVVPALDRIIKMTKQNVSALTVKDSPQTTTYVVNTDYKIFDAARGLLYIPSGSAITAGQTIKCGYTYGVVGQLSKVQIAQAPVIEGALYFVSVPGKGPGWDCEIWKMRVGGNGDLGLIQQDDWGVLSIEGTILADAANHPTEPYGIFVKRS